MKKFISLFVLIAVLFVAPLWAADERAKTDRSSRTHTLLVVDDTNDEIRKLTSTTNGLKVDASAGGAGTADQGISGVSDADPWNMMLRDSSGVELGLAASPFGVSLFDAASNLLGVTANPLVVDLGINNDVVIQDTAGSPGSVRLSDGTNFYDGATQTTVASVETEIKKLSLNTEDYDTGGAAETMVKLGIAIPGSGGSTAWDGTVVGNIAEGDAASNDPVLVGTKDALGNSRYFLVDASGVMATGVRTAGSDGVSNGRLAQLISDGGVNDLQIVANSYFNNTSWDRMRGNTDGLFVQGTVADGATAAGFPVRIAGKSSAGNTEDIAVSPNGELALVNKVTGVDGFSNTRLGFLFARTGESQLLQTALSVFNGTSWDMARGTITKGLLVDPSAATGADHKSVVVGTGPTLILAADPTRTSAKIENVFTDTVATGNSDVTNNTTAATDGDILSASSVAGDGKGEFIVVTHTGAIYGAGSSGSSKVTVTWETK